MKKTICSTIILILFFLFLGFDSSQAEDVLANRLSGYILLETEARGQMWYVSPAKNNRRIIIQDENDLFNLIKQEGIGISNDNISKIPISLDYLYGHDTDRDGLPDSLEIAIGTEPFNPDTDGDGYDDYLEVLHGYDPLGPGRLNYDYAFAESQAGRILIQVHGRGEAWYVNPSNNRRYFLGTIEQAFNVFSKVAIGISNTDIASISSYELERIYSIPKEEIKVRIESQDYPLMRDFTRIVTISTEVKEGLEHIKELGLVWDYAVIPNISVFPTIFKNKQRIISSEVKENFSLDIVGLLPSTYPFLRPYAITKDGQVFYGEMKRLKGINTDYVPRLPLPSSGSTIKKFPYTPPEKIPEKTPTDPCNGETSVAYQGYTYDIVEIGDQCWFAENLKYLPEGEEFSDSESSSESDPHYYVYNYNDGGNVSNLTEDDLDMYNTYGILYNWSAVMNNESSPGSQGLCPEGWYVPSAYDWNNLNNYFVNSAASRLAGNYDLWEDGALRNNHAFSESNFNALPGGYNGFYGFGDLGFSAYFHTSSLNNDLILLRLLEYDKVDISNTQSNPERAFSLRCIKKQEEEEEEEEEEEQEEEIIISCGDPSYVCGEECFYENYTYSTASIGGQCWMTENLRYDDGCSDVVWSAGLDNGWCGYYQDNEEEYGDYGLLYQWSAAMAGSIQEADKGLCPEGWHVPSHDDFTDLERSVCDALGNEECETEFPKDTDTLGFIGSNEGDALKSQDTHDWCYGIPGCENSDFVALPAGIRIDLGFSSFGGDAYFWTSSIIGSGAWGRRLFSAKSSVARYNLGHSGAYSLRCLRN